MIQSNSMEILKIIVAVSLFCSIGCSKGKGIDYPGDPGYHSREELELLRDD
ncbi:MAG: hypothetical protein S4CHLAM45_08640 [Chlamydiales bacterium]|nr:hypothetical protein [Chlamydiales bacterium]MCH9620386.1 hypothetical protein [Chlamydiales bacterium]MCH9622968.1 hypothetical protein [Chlamydiales bacterium]